MAWPQPLRILLRSIYFALAALGLLVVVVTVSPLDHWWAAKLAGPWNDARDEGLIVLGGSMLDTGTIGGSSYWCSVYAAQAWRGTSVKWCSWEEVLKKDPLRKRCEISWYARACPTGDPPGKHVE